MVCKELWWWEVGDVRIPRAVWKAYFASECGKRAITRAEAAVYVSITQQMGGGEFVYGKSRICGEIGISEQWERERLEWDGEAGGDAAKPRDGGDG